MHAYIPKGMYLFHMACVYVCQCLMIDYSTLSVVDLCDVICSSGFVLMLHVKKVEWLGLGTRIVLYVEKRFMLQIHGTILY